MESIRIQITKSLPNLSSSILESLLNLLDEIGVHSEEDLKYVEEKELATVLKPIQARKLIDTWKQIDSVTEALHTKSETATANQSGKESETQSSEEPNKSRNSELILQNISNDWYRHFNIPWEHMPEELIKDLEEGRRPHPKGRRDFINITAKAIHKLCPKPGKMKLNKIAQEAIEKYAALSDVWCDELVAGGCDSLTRSLVVKFENLNRNNVFNAVKRNVKRSVPNDEENLKVTSLSNYGCLNWQPKLLPVGESEKTQEEKRNTMIKIARTLKPQDKIPEEILSLLKTTYFSIRSDINHLKKITELTSTWPLLFTEKGFFQHFSILTGINLKNIMEVCSTNKIPRIINYFKNLAKEKKVFKTIFEKFEMDQSRSDLKLVILLLLQYFQEKSEGIFISVDSSLTSKDIEAMVQLPNTPSLILSGEDSLNELYMISVDKKIINESINNFDSAFYMVFGAYFILNIEYSEMASATLEFVQRCFLRMNPDKGSKAPKIKKRNMHYRVLSLLNKLMDFEWC